MIVRISGEAQYEVSESVIGELNLIDEELERAVEAADESGFHEQLERMLSRVRESGIPLAADELVGSDLILPPDDISLSEIAGALSTDGLIPDRS